MAEASASLRVTQQPVPAPQLPKPQPLVQSAEEKSLLGKYQHETQDLEQRLKPIEAEKSQLATEIGSVQAPPAPQLEQVPQFQPRQLDQGEMLTFAAVATAFAGIAARAVHGDIATALNGAAGAIKGFNEGNLQQAKLDIANFNTKMGAVLQKNNQMLTEYRTALEDRKLTLAQKMNQWRLVSAKYDDEIAMSALRKGDLQFAIQLQQKRDLANWQLEQLTTRMNASLMSQAIKTDALLKARGASGSGQSGLTPLATDYLAAYVQLNGRMPIGMSRQNPMAIDTMNATALAAQKAGLSPSDWAAAGPVTKEKLGALGQLEKQRNAIQAFEGMLDLNIGILKGLSKKIGRSGSPYANRPILWLQQHAAGDPDVAEYLFQVNTVTTEIARVLNNPNMSGQLTDAARSELQGVVSGTLNADQMDAVLDRAQNDARNRSHMLDAQEQKVIAEIRDPLHAVGGTQKPGGGPNKGDVENGYRFKGGDPSKPENWEKVAP